MSRSFCDAAYACPREIEIGIGFLAKCFDFDPDSDTDSEDHDSSVCGGASLAVSLADLKDGSRKETLKNPILGSFQDATRRLRSPVRAFFKR
jgi:hypothetical protein